MRALTLGVALLALAAPAQAQPSSLWTDVPEASLHGGERVTVPVAYRTVRLDRPQMAARLAAAPPEGPTGGAAGGVALSIPLPGGGFAEVRAVEASVLAPELQAQFPDLRTYLVQGEAGVHGRVSLTPAGFRAMLFTPEGTVFVDPYARGDLEHFVVYFAADLQVDPAARGRGPDTVVEPEPEPGHEHAPGPGPGAGRANGATLRTYRLAVAATGEYTAFHGGTVALSLAAIVTSVNRVTGVYERDLAVRFQLVANNNLIIYTNAATDPYTNGDPLALLGQNQANLDAVLGSANYDVGHVFATNSGGIAGLGVVCRAGTKAQGVTGSGAPVGDAFDIDYVAHEIGHQFGANHTFNSTTGACGGNRNASTAYEPGSGSTIMSYAGICGSQDLQPNSDPFFHAASLDEITAFIGTGGSCGTATPTNNPLPTVTAPVAVAIPIATPFALTGSATDDTPGALTYLWEDLNLGPANGLGSTSPPFFRSFPASPSPTRAFPQRSRLLAGQPPVLGEALPTVGRALTFRLTVRDNRAGGGAFGQASTVVTTVAAAGPFAVTSQSAAGQTLAGAVAVTWDVAGTTAAPVGTSAVDILFSADNGATFGTVLAAATPNDGAATVVLPNAAVAQGRLMVRAVGNVFYAVNARPFAVAAVAAPAVAGAAGWRLLAPGAAGVTVADLAALNLVQGVPGFYPPPQAQPNLLTGYDGTAFSAPVDGATALPPGRGFFWYFYNQNLTPGGPSNSFALPTTLATPRPIVTEDTPVGLHASGDRFNLLGNPFHVGLDVSAVGTWPGASALASTVVQMWNAAGSTYETSVTRPTIGRWQGFFAEAASAGTLTVPAAARSVGGTLARTAPGAVVAFELAEAAGERVDRAAVLTLSEAGRDGPDPGDAAKLAPPAAEHVLLAFADGGALRAVESRPLAPVSVPLAVASAGAGADLVLTWPRVEGVPEGWALVLRDLETGATADLAEGSAYAFRVAPEAARAAVPGGRAAARAPRFELIVGPRGTTAAPADAPPAFAFDAPRPNPARGAAQIPFSLAEAGPVRLSVVDLLGREVAVVAEDERPAGAHAEALDASRLAPGVYVVRLVAGGAVRTQRLVVVR